MTALLEARHVTKRFGGGLFDRTSTVALDDFSMTIAGDAPSITAIVGESGSGKTTLARLLLGVTSPTEGSVLYKGKDLRSLSGDESRGFLNDVQVIFQDPFEVYNPFYRVDHVLTTPIDYMKLAKSNAEKWHLIEQALETVGLRPEETLGRYPHQLSGGQRQRVMVARALILKPRIILADEPVSMIDASLRATVLGSLQRIKEEFGISIIYITHDLTTAYQIGDNIIVLYRGSVAEAGSVDLVVRQPNHPYTRLLVGSIPVPDPDQPWTAEAAPALPNQPRNQTACKFADRCPAAMTKCLQQAPQLYQTDAQRAAACFLYEQAPVLSTEHMDRVFQATIPLTSPVAQA
ncbi:MAG: ABC transporter ATP-binding protein [Chloroflexi bacterium]|nr:ABC transporter ATP-binding protein [Chloroflexota bacterium]